MLPKKHRLPLRTELKRVQKKGRLYQGRLFSLLVRQKFGEQSPPRFAFIISKKIHKNAAKRNRIRRLLSESVYSLLSSAEDGFDGVFLVKREILEKELLEIKDGMEKIFQKSGVIQDE